MRRSILTALLVAGLAGSVQAQPPRSVSPPVRQHAIVLVGNGGAAIVPGSLTQSFSTTINAEEAPIAATLSHGPAPFVEGGLQAHVAGRFSVGAVGFVANGTSSGTVDASIPHPFFFNQRRDVSGDVSGLPRRTLGAHVDAGIDVPIGSRRIRLVGGPSLVRVEQAVVTDVQYTDAYPYDTASFTGTTHMAARRFAAGFNAGAETTWRLGRRWEVAALLRYSRANVRLTVTPANTAELKAAAIELGAGLRIPF